MSGACRLPGTPEQKEFDKKEYLMWPFYPELPILPKDIENIIIDYLYQLEHVELMTKCKKKIIDIIPNLENVFKHIICTEIDGRHPMPVDVLANYFNIKIIIFYSKVTILKLIF